MTVPDNPLLMAVRDVSGKMSYKIQRIEHAEVGIVTGVKLIRPVYNLPAIARRSGQPLKSDRTPYDILRKRLQLFRIPARFRSSHISTEAGVMPREHVYDLCIPFRR